MLLTVSAIISIAYMSVTTVYTLISLIFSDRKTRNKRIRNYKNGNFLIHYLASFPLFLAAYVKDGEKIVLSIISAIKSTFKTALLSFDVGLLWPYMEDAPIFLIAVGLYAFLTLLNTALFSISVFSRRVLNYIRLRRIEKGKHNVVVLLGYTDKNRSVLHSMERDGGRETASKENYDVLVLSNEISDGMKDDMYIHRAAYLSFSKEENIAELLKKRCARFDRRHVTVIIQTESDTENLKYAFQLASLASELKEDVGREFNDSNFGIDVYIFTEGHNDSVYRKITKISRGAVHCLNRYNVMARDFISKYPLTLFLPEQIDTEKAVFKDGTDFRVAMIGFGKTNRQLFCAYVQNNQFLISDRQGELREMSVKYHIFDNKHSEEDSTFNHTYMHYESWLKKHSSPEEKEKYFELPKKPADVTFHERDINNNLFAEEFKDTLTASDKGYNVIILALGEDISALNLAEKLVTYAKEMHAEKRTKIFVRVRDAALSKEVAATSEGETEIIPFGNFSTLYSYKRITTHEADKVAKDRHLCYAIESKKQGVSDESAKRDALKRWHFEWRNIQRESNAYACLAMRARFHLLGYELVRKTAGMPDESKEFFADYTRGNPIKYDGKVINGKTLVDYSEKYHLPGTPRTNLAICEHSRWNAYHICSGFVPASKEEYKTEGKGALLDRRKHINITTMTGLTQYADWQIKEYGISRTDADVIKYDYQLMDDALWLLDRSGYTVIKRKTTKETEDDI